MLIHFLETFRTRIANNVDRFGSPDCREAVGAVSHVVSHADVAALANARGGVFTAVEKLGREVDCDAVSLSVQLWEDFLRDSMPFIGAGRRRPEINQFLLGGSPICRLVIHVRSVLGSLFLGLISGLR